MSNYATHRLKIIAIFFTIFITACGTTDSQMRSDGHTQTYIQDYRPGWLAGEIEGHGLQEQAIKTENAVGGAYSGVAIGSAVEKEHDFDKTAKEALKNTDASTLKGLKK